MVNNVLPVMSRKIADEEDLDSAEELDWANTKSQHDESETSSGREDVTPGDKQRNKWYERLVSKLEHRREA